MLAEIADKTGGITFAKGFVAGGLHCGAKKDKLDLAIVKADSPCSAAAVFTTNRVKAAPVLVGMERLASGACQALVINSGHANACTGPEGIQAAREMAARCGRELGVPD
ncbi:MAG: bifunctional ornithine acetyltransferase/N-acetylglutamate synthase, partial [Firmicutes bacterium]|nr:bifunctional ornithine acetyltransferase/N-acetylglutamate synthase [Bacillota bacterium]